jgi:hypothetical protein
VELRRTQGSAENLALLQSPDSGVDSAFVQAAPIACAGPASRRHRLLSLGSCSTSRLWLFYREAAARERLGTDRVDSLGQLRGWRVNIGAEGQRHHQLMCACSTQRPRAGRPGRRSGSGRPPPRSACWPATPTRWSYTSAPRRRWCRCCCSRRHPLMDFPQAEATRVGCRCSRP